jgi:hypothetical protein
MICVKVSYNDHKYGLLSEFPNLKGLGIFINEYLIPEEQVEFRKKVEKVKKDMKEGKWTIIRNKKDNIRNINKKDNNKYQFGTCWVLSRNCWGFP